MENIYLGKSCREAISAKCYSSISGNLSYTDYILIRDLVRYPVMDFVMGSILDLAKTAVEEQNRNKLRAKANIK